LDLDRLKQYLRIDGTEEDDFLGFLMETAKEFLKGAGVEESESNRYELAVMILVSHWYENREAIGKVTSQIEYSLQSLILQLKYSDTGSESM